VKFKLDVDFFFQEKKRDGYNTLSKLVLSPGAAAEILHYIFGIPEHFFS